MSIHYMSDIWKLDLKTGKKMVLLKFGDNANDEGVAWPSLERVAAEAGCGVSTVRAIVKELREDKVLLAKSNGKGGQFTNKGVRFGKTTRYQIDIQRAFELYGACVNCNPPDLRGLLANPPESSIPYIEEPSSRKNHHLVGERARATPQESVGGFEYDHSPKGTNHAGKQETKRGTRLAPDWKPSSKLGFRTTVEAHTEFAKFRDYWIAKPGKDGLKLDWEATWRNWLRRAAEYRAERGGGRERPASVLDATRELLSELALDEGFHDSDGASHHGPVSGSGFVAGRDCDVRAELDSSFGEPVVEGARDSPIIDHEPDAGGGGIEGDSTAVRPKTDGVSGGYCNRGDPESGKPREVVASMGRTVLGN